MNRGWIALNVLLAVSILTLLVLIASGCHIEPKPDERPALAQEGVSAALQGWREAGLPPPMARCDFGRARVRWARDVTDFVQTCRTDAPVCLKWDSSRHFFRSYMYPVVFLRPGFVLQPDSEPVIHEMMHALYYCAGLPDGSPGNRKHLDPRVWSAAGGETSAQSRARALMR